MTRTPFEALVEEYDAARPSYPDALYDALAGYAGGLAGALVVECGAGTGLATRALRGRGATVLATDLGEAMLRRNAARTPGLPAAVADGHALPVRDGTADLVCYAQAWHWMRLPDAVAEAVRVLRPGGSLAVWWNDAAADGQPWYDRQQDRLEALSPGYTRDYRKRDYGAELSALGLFGAVRHAAVDWVRPLSIEEYLVYQRSKSYVAAIPDLAGYLREEEAELRAAFPDGTVAEPLRTRLWVATR
ncbi:MAG: class I SAM-dependent methyltransferase [Mycobacteriales bacterium]